MRKPTEKELAIATKRKPVYKVVRVQDKKLLSLWVRRPTLSTDIFRKKFKGATITYGRGKLSGNGRYGI